MKKIYFFFPALILTLMNTTGFSQAIMLNDNHNLSGFPFRDNIILTSDVDSTIWISDGTPSGTVQVSPVKLDTTGAAILDGRLYFSGLGPGGFELWSTDGTNGGTTQVSDIWPGPEGSRPDDFVIYKNKLYFTAHTPAIGRELYEYSGSGAPSAISDLNVGVAASFETPWYLVANDLLYFDAVNSNGKALYAFNGLTITKLQDFPAGYHVTGYCKVANNLFLSISNGSNGMRLYKITGSSISLMQAFTGPFSGFIPPQMIGWNGKLFFTVAALGMDNELWVCDGSTTQMVKDINPGQEGSYPLIYQSVILQNKLIFSARSATFGSELWYTDGTEAGTGMLIDLEPTPGRGSDPILWPITRDISRVTSELFNADIYDRELNFNGFIFFSASLGGDQRGLFKTNGTLEGTTRVSTVNSGGWDRSESYIYTKSGIMFAGDDGISGNEPWFSDGTEAGTVPIANINTAGDAQPEFYFIWKGDMYLLADNGNGGPDMLFDFYKLKGPYSPLPVVLDGLTVTPVEEGAFLKWKTLSESNADKFEILRSTDGLHFKTIGEVQAVGNSTTATAYSYLDRNVFGAGAGVVYYRINMKDRDGKTSLSRIVKVPMPIPASFQLQLYPNPADAFVTIRYTSAEAASLQLTDLQGRVLMQRPLAAAVDGSVQLNIAHLASGTYLLKYNHVTNNKTIRFVKN